MKEGFYIVESTSEVVFLKNGYTLLGSVLCLHSNNWPEWHKPTTLTPLPYFRDISSPTTEELKMLQMVDEKCYNEVVKIMKEMEK